MAKPKAFIFDDDPQIVIRHEALLKKDFDIITAPSYDDAIIKIKEFKYYHTPPVIALLDIKQDINPQKIPTYLNPDKAGFYLAKEIREISFNIPIIFVTAYPSEYKIEAEQYAPYAFFEKTNQSLALAQIVKDILANTFAANWQRLPKGKMCIHDRNKNYIINIDDILFFEGIGGGVTLLKLCSSNEKWEYINEGKKGSYIYSNFKEFTFTLNPIDFRRQLEHILALQELNNPFRLVKDGKYARLDSIVAYDDGYIYFDYECKVAIEINKSTLQFLNEKYQAITTDKKYIGSIPVAPQFYK
jgi:DNA-binding LytR/AlgR family response regulator